MPTFESITFVGTFNVMRPSLFKITLIVISMASSGLIQGQHENEAALNYILTYKDIAIQEMRRTGIPASIKLGQGLLESNIGASRLATEANNHFGAKCHNTWFGETIAHDDDAPQECFRKYASPIESYVDHSYVLAKDRYLSLYHLSIYDYENWAIGLKAAGYATDPNYASKLINIIERYALFVYDRMEHYPNSEVVMVDNKAKMKFNFVSLERKEFNEELVPPPREVTKLQKRISKKIGKISTTRVQKFNGVDYVMYTMPVWPVQASNAYGLTLSELLDYNYAELSHRFKTNERIYLEPMRKKAPRKNRIHQISEDETMRDVALIYAMDLKALYEFNGIPYGAQPRVGEILYLRSTNPIPPACLPSVNQIVPSFEKAIQEETTAWASITNEFLTKKSPRTNRFELPNDSSKVYNVRSEILQVELDGMIEFDFTQTNTMVIPAPTDGGTPILKKPIADGTPSSDISSESNTTSSGEKVYHVVKSGDTLSEIAEEYEITVSKLKQLNSLKSTVIKIGQKLRVE